MHIYIYMMEKSTFRMVPRTMEPSEDRWGDEHVWTKSLDRAARRRIPLEKPGPPIKGRWLYQGKAHILGTKIYKNHIKSSNMIKEWPK